MRCANALPTINRWHIPWSSSLRILPDRSHRQQQYQHLAQRHLTLVIEGQIQGSEWDGARLVQLEANEDGSVLALVVEIDAPDEGREFDPVIGPDSRAVEALEGLLRAELAQHVPRRRTPRLRVLLQHGFS